MTVATLIQGSPEARTTGGALPPGHPAVPPRKIGVLLINLGTPDAPDAPAVRRYLKQFLSDRRVVEIPALLWQPILRGIILNTRPKKSAHAYGQVWTALAAMKAAGCERILVAPLYPQFCAATTATANDAAFAALIAMRWQPALRTLPPYHDDALYIDALARSVTDSLAKLPFAPDAILASFHGMPKRTLQLGDPYHCHCQKTARLLSDRLERPLTVTFQSRFGPAKWLEPATDLTLAALPGQGVRKVAIVSPGFSADCLETLEELDIRGRETFMAAGGTDFAYLPCLNDSAVGMEMLERIVGRELAGWCPPA